VGNGSKVILFNRIIKLMDFSFIAVLGVGNIVAFTKVLVMYGIYYT
jgi:hypothetical protein